MIEIEILLTLMVLVVFGLAYKVYDSVCIVYAVLLIMAKLGNWNKGTILISFILGTIMHLLRMSFFVACQEYVDEESEKKDEES